MKHTFAPTSNPNFNVPMTTAQWSVIDFIAFESETSLKYPFKKDFDDLNMETIDKIVEICEDLEDTDAIYEACEKVLGSIKE
jgi:hypothetical protein